MRYKFLSITLVLALLLSMLPAGVLTASAYSETDIAYPVEGGNIYFDKASGTITDCDTSVTSANIPAEIDGVAVTGIGDRAFYDCTSLTSVTIPDSVTSIGHSAFFYCTRLTSVTIPDSVTSIGNSAFRYCISLVNVTIPDSVTSVGNSAFEECRSLTNVTIPDSVTSIGDYAFYGCTSLTSVTIPDGVTSIGDSAFYGCTSLTNVTIPDGVTSIGDYAFCGCTSLTSVTIPGSVTSIGYNAAYCCDSLTGIWVSEVNEYYSSDGSGVLFNKDKTTLIQAPGALSGAYTIPVSVISIRAGAFTCCYSLTSVTIPDSVTSIGDCAFSCCDSLTSVTIPDSVTSISVGAFQFCSNLTSVTIQANVTSIGEKAFFSCDSLTSVTIPDSVTSIGMWAFDWCDSLSDVYYCGTEEMWNNIVIEAFNGDLLDATIHFDYVPDKETCSHSNTAVRNAQEATCTEVGYTGDTYCSDCGVLVSSGTTINALGHDYGQWRVNKAPTCTAEGEEIRSCSRCDSTESRKLAATGHSYTASVTAPTCTQKGYTTYTCACGDSYTADEVAALGHDYGQWRVNKAPTCTAEGEEIRSCSRCDSTESRKLAATGHSYTASVTAPTCTEKGYTTYTCACGDSYTADEVAALGHDYHDGACSRCGEEDPDYESEIPPAEFGDVTEDAWYRDAVDYAVANGLMNGTGNNRFEPERSMTRAMLVTVLWRYAGEPTEGENIFSDVEENQWYTQAVAWAAENGIVGGVGNGKFEPDGEITREQMAAILYRYCNSVGIDTSKRESLNGFPDGDKTSAYAQDAISWAVAEGLIAGSKVNGKLWLAPQGNATRAQVATILMRFLENVAK